MEVTHYDFGREAASLSAILTSSASERCHIAFSIFTDLY